MTARAAVFVGLALVSGFTAPPVARADDSRARAKSFAARATAHYEARRYRQALDDYGRAYELVPAAALLFNIAQCHKELERFQLAILFFEQYLRAAPQAINGTVAHELIEESRTRWRQSSDRHALRRVLRSFDRIVSAHEQGARRPAPNF